jgi:DNA invertase Pin-like site-specific DNA recombinase
MADDLLHSAALNKPCPLPAGSKVFTYARDSGGETQERSVDEQIRLYDAYAEQHNLIIVRHFHDRARPGSSMIGRDGLEQLLAEARRQPRAGDGILFWSLDRLSRDQLECQFLTSDLRLRGYTLIFLSNDIPDVGGFAYVIEAFYRWKGHEDLMTISRNAKRGLADLVARKKADGSYEGFMPGIPPRGYKGEPVAIGTKRDGSARVNQRWIADPTWWKKCSEAWRLRADGWSVAEIHRKIHIFKSNTCYTTFFRNPVYKGELHYGGMVLKDFVPRMVDEETWAKVRKMHELLRKHAPARVDSRRLFAGLAYCELCGSPLRGFDYRRNGKILYQYYGCTGRERKTCKAPMIPAEPFEREVMETVCARILTPATLLHLADGLRRRTRKGVTEADETIMLLRQELQATEKAIHNLVASGEQAPLSVALGKALEEQERRTAGIRAQIAELQAAKIQQPSIPDYSEEELSALADRLRKALRQPTQESRAALRGFITRIVAGKKRAMIYYTFPIEDGAAGPGGAFVYLRSLDNPVGAPTERRISVEWILRPETKKDRNDEIRVRRRAGDLHREIAQVFGISLQRVGQISHKNYRNKIKK